MECTACGFAKLRADDVVCPACYKDLPRTAGELAAIRFRRQKRKLRAVAITNVGIGSIFLGAPITFFVILFELVDWHWFAQAIGLAVLLVFGGPIALGFLLGACALFAAAPSARRGARPALGVSAGVGILLIFASIAMADSALFDDDVGYIALGIAMGGVLVLVNLFGWRIGELPSEPVQVIRLPAPPGKEQG